ncbi:MAG: glycine--tRNA ligase, partial [Planctomycetota bacterium]
MAEQADNLMEKIVALCKRRGFIWQSSEIYGGINGFWDYGPLGVELKRNIKQAWWEDTVRRRDDIVGLDAAIIMNPKVWEASGHVGSFNDPRADCKQCRSRFRADKVYTVAANRLNLTAPNGQPHIGLGQLLRVGVEADSEEEAKEAAISQANSQKRRELKKNEKQIAWLIYRADKTENVTVGKEIALCPNCGGELTEARKFNMMFPTYIGAMEDSSAKAYLRPETAQGIFCNFKNVLDTQRLKLPFGIAQLGKAFRNEINPRNYTFRSREFEQMEIEFFCRPDEADEWYAYWRDLRYKWYVDHGLTSDKLRLRDHEPDELAHYARACADVEYAFPFGVSELEGVANRTDYD